MADGGLPATFTVAGRWGGIVIARVQRVLIEPDLEPVPLAAAGVLGPRVRMGLPQRDHHDPVIHHIVDPGDGSGSLLADAAGAVITLAGLPRPPAPETTPAAIVAMLLGAYQHPDGLLLVIGPSTNRRASQSR